MITLDGCRTEPLGSYLQALGTWRAIRRTPGGDPEARAHWQAGRLVLTTRLDADAIVAALRDTFAPLPLVSPWNAGSGFAGNGKNAEAERALALVRASNDPRLADLRGAVLAADRIVAEGRTRGWAGAGDKLWDEGHKPDVIQLCRNMLPDAALLWLDAAVVLGQDAEGREAPTYNRLLGTGGNFGRLDLQNAYVQRALAVLHDPKTSPSSEGWLRSALFADERTPYLRESVGQFDPGRAGGIQSSPREKGDDTGFANPWLYLLTIEGTLLFASAATRRLGARTSSASVPFVVRGSPVGFASTASAEQPSGEVWTPQWNRPATLPEIEQLIGEGRADWNGRAASTGLDFVRAVATLGVDRGISRFTRHVVVERLGQSPLAVPAGEVDVADRTGAGLLADVDAWLGHVSRERRPGAVEAGVRRVQAGMFEVGRGGGADALREVVVGLGRLHEAVGRSGAAAAAVRPLVLAGATWWPALADDAPLEWRLAAALASGRDYPHPHHVRVDLRSLLTPVLIDRGGRAHWTGRPAEVPFSTDLVTAVVGVHRARARAGAVVDPETTASAPVPPAVRGTYSAFCAGLEIDVRDVVALAEGRMDLAVAADALAGLLLLAWRGVDGPMPAFPRRARPLPPLLALLLPFYATGPLRVRLREDDAAAATVLLRPHHSWPTRLAAGAVESVVDDAVSRLRAAGVRDVARPCAARADGTRLAAALLLRVPQAARYDALRRIAVLPDQRTTPSDAEAHHDHEGVPA